MCKIMEDLNKKAATEAAKEAAYQKQKQIAKSLINKGKMDFEDIADSTGLTVMEVKTLAEGETA